MTIRSCRTGGRAAFSAAAGVFSGIRAENDIMDGLEEADDVMLETGANGFAGSKTAKSMYAIEKAFLELTGRGMRLEDAPPRHGLKMN